MKGLAVGLNKGFITTKITKPRERAVLCKGTQLTKFSKEFTKASTWHPFFFSTLH